MTVRACSRPGPAERWPALRRHAIGNGLLDILILWRSERMRPEPQRAPELLAAFAQKLDAALALLEREAAALVAAPVAIDISASVRRSAISTSASPIGRGATAIRA